MALDGNDGFDATAFKETADLLRCGQEATVRATLSNRFNIILAALDRCVLTMAMNARMDGMPTQPGFYWAKWRIPSDDTPKDLAETLPHDKWEMVDVWVNCLEETDPEHMMVHVPGVAQGQGLENFIWGPGPVEAPRARIEGNRRRVLARHRNGQVDWLDRRTADGRVQDALSREGLIIQSVGLRGGGLGRFKITPLGLKVLDAEA